jgi:hypothetical protein
MTKFSPVLYILNTARSFWGPLCPSFADHSIRPPGFRFSLPPRFAIHLLLDLLINFSAKKKLLFFMILPSPGLPNSLCHYPFFWETNCSKHFPLEDTFLLLFGQLPRLRRNDFFKSSVFTLILRKKKI